MTCNMCRVQSEAGEGAEEALLLQPREVSLLRPAPREHSRLGPAHLHTHAQAHAEALAQAQMHAAGHAQVQGLVQAQLQAQAPAPARAQTSGPGLPLAPQALLKDLPTSGVPLRALGEERAAPAQSQRPGHGLPHPSRLQPHAPAAGADCGSEGVGGMIGVAARARATRLNAAAPGAAPAAGEADSAAGGVSWAADLERGRDTAASAGPGGSGAAAHAEGRMPLRSLAGPAEGGHTGLSQEQRDAAVGGCAAPPVHPVASQEGAWEPPILRAATVLSGIAEGSQDGLSQEGGSRPAPARSSSLGEAPEGSGALPSIPGAGPEGARPPPLMRTGTIGLYHTSMQAPGAPGGHDDLLDAPAVMLDVLGDSPFMNPDAAGAAAPAGPGLGGGSRASVAPASWAPGVARPSPPRFSAAGSPDRFGHTSGLGYDASGRRASAAGARASVVGRRLSGAPAQGQGPGLRGSVVGAGGAGGGNDGGGLLRRIATVLGAGEDSAAVDGAAREHEAVPRRQSVVEALLVEQLRAGKARPSRAPECFSWDGLSLRNQGHLLRQVCIPAYLCASLCMLLFARFGCAGPKPLVRWCCIHKGAASRHNLQRRLLSFLGQPCSAFLPTNHA